jgi:hypothetical protein
MWYSLFYHGKIDYANAPRCFVDTYDKNPRILPFLFEIRAVSDLVWKFTLQKNKLTWCHISDLFSHVRNILIHQWVFRSAQIWMKHISVFVALGTHKGVTFDNQISELPTFRHRNWQYNCQQCGRDTEPATSSNNPPPPNLAHKLSL